MAGVKQRKTIRQRIKWDRLTYKKKRGYAIAGEELPSDKSEVPLWIWFVVGGFFVFFFFSSNYIGGVLIDSWAALGRYISNKKIETSVEKLFSSWNAVNFNRFWLYYVVILLIDLLLSGVIYKKLKVKFQVLARGQEGDNRLTERIEIQEQYVEIPEKDERFPGVGGVPISHWECYYYIDTDTVNTLVIGASRSGKGESEIIPMIDNLSRAEEQSSIVANDPKGELYAASKETLEARGYQVEVLNMIDPMQSMSFQVLSLTIEAWNQKDYPRVEMLVNSLTYSMYYEPDAGQNAHFNDTAQGLVNALILASLEECTKRSELKKVTMYNIGQTFIELAGKKWVDETTFQEKNALDEYFRALPQGSIAKAQYGSVSFASDRERGSILSTAIKKLRIFQFETIAKMTSESSFQLKSVGFPRELIIHFNEQLFNQRMKVTFRKKGEIIGVETIKPNMQGIVVLNFNYDLKTEDEVAISLEKRENGKVTRLETTYTVERIRKIDSEDYERKVKLHCVADSLQQIEYMEMNITDKPIAVFMITPDAEPSLNIIPTMFVSQLYKDLIQNATNTRGKKCHRRVHLILDEFGNMPPIDNMDNNLTVCLGRNILFTCVVQSYHQLFHLYGEKVGEIMKENFQNHIYIMSGNMNTIKEISEKVGNKTEEKASLRDKTLSVDVDNTKSVGGIRNLTPERVATLIEGETIVIRTTHRRDNKRRKVRPFPIFNTQETSMPYRFEFLGDFFDTSKDLNEFDIPSKHRYLSLQELAIDSNEWISHLPVPEETTFEVSDMLIEEEEPLIEEKLSLHGIFEKYDIRESLMDMIIDALGESKNRAKAVILQYIKDEEIIEALQEYIDTNYS